MNESDIFKRKKINIERLLAYGFRESGDAYHFSASILDGQFCMDITFSKAAPSNPPCTRIVDTDSNEEYVLHRIPGATGSFVGAIKAARDHKLMEIAKQCFDPDVFKSDDAKKVISYVHSTYGDDLEFLWKKSPDNAIIRRKDNQKWYAALLTVSRVKLGFSDNTPAEVIDLRIQPDRLETLLDGTRYLPGYHMNKKNWFTICLDGSVPIEEIYRWIDNSFRLAAKK